MKKLYMTFKNEKEANDILSKFDGLEIANPCPMPVNSTVLVDGELITKTANGYHVNAITNDDFDISGLEKYLTYPESPFAVWLE